MSHSRMGLLKGTHGSDRGSVCVVLAAILSRAVPSRAPCPIAFASALSDLPLKDPLPPDTVAAGEPRPDKVRNPIGWSTIMLAALVAVSAVLVYRRDGVNGLTEILSHDMSLFGGILPRVLAGCLLGAFIAEILPHDKVSKS